MDGIIVAQRQWSAQLSQEKPVLCAIVWAYVAGARFAVVHCAKSPTGALLLQTTLLDEE